MAYLKCLFMALIILLPLNVFAGSQSFTKILNTDIMGDNQITTYYDLRNRKTYIQVTNDGTDTNGTVSIHIQIFQADRGCSELNFNDKLTINDTVVYDLDNLIRNDGTGVPIKLQDDSYGYVVITTNDNGDAGSSALIGNVRIVDLIGNFEYRTNTVGINTGNTVGLAGNDSYITNFNTINGANQADIIGYGIDEIQNSISVKNLEGGYTFNVFVFDMHEEPLSCDTKNFACGPGTVMNYGLNDDYLNSRNGALLCEGARLPTGQKGGFVTYEFGTLGATDDDSDADETFVGFIGINNNDGTGSFDIWHYFDDDTDTEPSIP